MGLHPEHVRQPNDGLDRQVLSSSLHSLKVLDRDFELLGKRLLRESVGTSSLRYPTAYPARDFGRVKATHGATVELSDWKKHQPIGYRYPQLMEAMLGEGSAQTRKGVPPGNASSPDDSVGVEELRISELTAFDSASRSAAPLALAQAREEAPLAAAPIHAREESTVLRANPTVVELTSGSLVGEYEVECKLGEGGMGAVYQAVHPVIGKRVAIKVIGSEISKDTRAIARFRREAKVVAQLSSSHIVDVFGFGELSDGRAYFVMEHLIGESLRDRLSRARLPLDEALELLDQITRGLEAAHDAGIVHRDLKPENVFIVRGPKHPVVKLLDFGLVKVAEHSDDIATTQAGVMFGTPLYCSPEQIRSAATVDHRSDIYALGAIAFEMILGRVPFERSTVVEIIAAHLEAQPPEPRSLWPKIPAVLDAVLSAMLAKEPSKRPTLGHFQEVIEKLRTSAFAPAEPPSTAKPSAKPVEPPTVFVTLGQAQPLPSLPEPSRRTSRHVAWLVGGIGLVLTVALTFWAMRDNAIDQRAPSDQRVEHPVSVTPIDVIVSEVITPDAGVPNAPQRLVQTSRPAHIRPSLTASGSGSGSGSSPTTQAASARTLAPPLSKPTGELLVSSKPTCEVLVDGVSRGNRMPLRVTLPVGTHQIRLRNPRVKLDEAFTVYIEAGKHTSLEPDLLSKALLPLEEK